MHKHIHTHLGQFLTVVGNQKTLRKPTGTRGEHAEDLGTDSIPSSGLNRGIPAL